MISRALRLELKTDRLSLPYKTIASSTRSSATAERQRVNYACLSGSLTDRTMR